MRINNVSSISLPHNKTEIRHALTVRHVDQKMPESIRGNEVVDSLKRVIRQASLCKTSFSGRAYVHQRLRKRLYKGDPV